MWQFDDLMILSSLMYIKLKILRSRLGLLNFTPFLIGLEWSANIWAAKTCRSCLLTQAQYPDWIRYQQIFHYILTQFLLLDRVLKRTQQHAAIQFIFPHWSQLPLGFCQFDQMFPQSLLDNWTQVDVLSNWKMISPFANSPGIRLR